MIHGPCRERAENPSCRLPAGLGDRGGGRGRCEQPGGDSAAWARGRQPSEARARSVLLPCTFFPAVMLFLEAFPELQRSTFCSRQQDVCLLFALFTKRNFSLMSAFNLYFLHAALVGCFGQEQSSGAAHVLFYHRAIKYLAFQRKNPVVAAGGSILVAAFCWLGLWCACAAS